MQQIIWNTVHAFGIIKSTWIPKNEIDELFTLMWDVDYGFNTLSIDKLKNWRQNKGKMLWDMWEGMFGEDRETNMLTNIIGDLNILAWADASTKSRAVRSSLAQAAHSIYANEWEVGLKFFKRDVWRFTDFKRDMWISDWDMIEPKYMMDRIWYAIEAKTKNLKGAEKWAEAKKLWDEAYYNISFYNNYYKWFKADVRRSMWVFYVMDSIPELSSIRYVDQNRWMFGLMKWALWKTSEYWYDITKAIYSHPRTLKWFADALNEPIFLRMANEIATAAQLWWVSDRATDWEIWPKRVLLSICAPMAASYMLIWETIANTIKAWKWASWRWEWAMGAIISSVWELVKEIADRWFLFEWMLANDIAKILNTAAVGKTWDDKLW